MKTFRYVYGSTLGATSETRRQDTAAHIGAAKVDFSPESCILLRKHETLHKCSIVQYL